MIDVSVMGFSCMSRHSVSVKTFQTLPSYQNIRWPPPKCVTRRRV